MKKIVFTGPESSGKSVLCGALARKYKVPHVTETARNYILTLERKYMYTDLLKIAQLQIQEEEKISLLNPSVLICDTDLITIKIWSEDKFGKCDKWIIRQINKRKYDMYFLCTPDFPWQYDVQREDAHRREELFDMYKYELDVLQKKYVILKNSFDKRLAEVFYAVQQM